MKRGEPQALVASIAPGSIAEELGLEPGDRIISINGHRLRDLIDYRFYGAEEELEILVRRGDEEAVFEVERDYGTDLGIEFTDVVFDGIRECVNNCTFCFIKGMPRAMRRSLYVRDDDYRLAFLVGNFITLSNLAEEDWRRIEEQHLSPLYVSVHSTDPDLRRRLIGNPDAPDILPQLRRLRDMGVEVHSQIVLTPGMNDGDKLAKTVTDLAELWPGVRSVGVVPVGLTRFQRNCTRTYTPEEAGPLLDRVTGWQKEFRRRFGRSWVYASDEWYLLAERRVPSAKAYDGFPQIENGIGLVRRLLDDWSRTARRRIPRADVPVTLICGKLIAPVLRTLAGELSAHISQPVGVWPVTNEFFGERVTVSGLLAGRDVRRALQDGRPKGLVFVPRSMFESEGRLTLDGLSLEDLGEGLDARVLTTRNMSEVVRQLSQAGATA